MRETLSFDRIMFNILHICAPDPGKSSCRTLYSAFQGDHDICRCECVPLMYRVPLGVYARWPRLPPRWDGGTNAIISSGGCSGFQWFFCKSKCSQLACIWAKVKVDGPDTGRWIDSSQGVQIEKHFSDTSQTYRLLNEYHGKWGLLQRSAGRRMTVDESYGTAS